MLSGLCLVTLLLIGTVCAQQHAPHAKTAPDTGTITNGLYRNPSFGFSYKLPFGWVERTQQMTEDSSDPKKSLLLLSLFERPPEVAGDAVNSAVVIAAESVSSYPGLKGAEDYFGPLTEVATGKGFKVTNEPYDFTLGTKHLVRGDFTKETGKLTMYQASLVVLEKGYVVSFTFIAGSEDEVEQLIENLSFVVTKPARKPVPR
jgi:hypothetical protein